MCNFCITWDWIKEVKFKLQFDSFLSSIIGVNLPQTAQPDSINCDGEVSLQKFEIIVCCNFNDGDKGENHVNLFCWCFLTAWRCEILYSSELFNWYCFTASRFESLYSSELFDWYCLTALRLEILYYSELFDW